MAGDLSLERIFNGDSTKSINTEYVIDGSAKAWFRATTAGALLGSFNISSLVDQGTGQVFLNITNVFNSVNYNINPAIQVSTGYTATIHNGILPTAGSWVQNCFNSSNVLTDPNYHSGCAHGDLA